MTIDNIDFWTLALWAHFSPVIESGSPCYLAADKTLIAELGRVHFANLNDEQIVQNFHQSVKWLLHRTQAKAIVKSLAFENIPGRPFSRVICLAVQQVLVVETMLRHEQQYSERSYFPRYRDLLGITRGHLHENPLGSAFQRVWSTLRREFLSVPGSVSSTITFAAGTGIDINRNLPLSQALFTRHDLNKLSPHSDILLLCIDNHDRLIQVLFTLRGLFTKRAQMLIAKCSVSKRLSDRISEQVISFLHAQNCIEVASQSRVYPSRVDICAFLEAEDWLESDVFAFYVLNNDVLSADPPAEDLLDKLFLSAASDAIALVAEEDRFINARARNVNADPDAIVAVVRQKNVHLFMQEISTQFPELSPVHVRTNLPTAFCGVLIRDPPSVLVNSYTHSSEQPQASALKLMGGMLTDARTRSYLAGYPPNELHCNGQQLSPATIVFVNDTPTTLGSLFSELRTVSQFTAFVLRHESHTLEFSVVDRPVRRKEMLVGYPLDRTEFAPTSTELNENQPSLRGTVLFSSNDDLEGGLEVSASDMVMLIEKGRRVALSNDHLELLVRAIEDSGQNDQLIRIAAQKLRTTKSVPLKLIAAGFMRKVFDVGK